MVEYHGYMHMRDVGKFKWEPINLLASCYSCLTGYGCVWITSGRVEICICVGLLDMHVYHIYIYIYRYTGSHMSMEQFIGKVPKNHLDVFWIIKCGIIKLSINMVSTIIVTFIM